MIAAFDHIAPQYNQLWTRSAVGHLQREAVWRHIGVLFERGETVLDLGCGTGEDALFLAQHDVALVACDASARMIETARRRMATENPDAPVEFRLLATEELAKMDRADLFDGAFSNFSGLNWSDTPGSAPVSSLR